MPGLAFWRKFWMIMELHQVRYFIATCETLNFTKAAEASNITQPALTKALKLLEEELGGPLFDRQSRPMRLTELGVNLRDKFHKLYDLSAQITAQARLFSNLDAAIYTLGIVSTIGEQTFLPFIESLQRSASGISLSIKMIPQGILISSLLEGSLEFAIITDINSNPHTLALTPLFEEEYFVAIPPGHELLTKSSISIQDFQGVDYIRRIHCELNPVIDTRLNASNVTINQRFATDQDAIAIKMFHAGLGVTILPASLCEGIDHIRPLSDPIKRTLALANLKNRELSPSAKVIKEFLLKWEH